MCRGINKIVPLSIGDRLKSCMRVVAIVPGFREMGAIQDVQEQQYPQQMSHSLNSFPLNNAYSSPRY